MNNKRYYSKVYDGTTNSPYDRTLIKESLLAVLRPYNIEPTDWIFKGKYIYIPYFDSFVEVEHDTEGYELLSYKTVATNTFQYIFIVDLDQFHTVYLPIMELESVLRYHLRVRDIQNLEVGNDRVIKELGVYYCKCDRGYFKLTLSQVSKVQVSARFQFDLLDYKDVELFTNYFENPYKSFDKINDRVHDWSYL